MPEDPKDITLETIDADLAADIEEGEPLCRCCANTRWLRERFESQAERIAELEAVKTCAWQREDGDIWEGSCGVSWEFMVDGPTENRVNFCPRCGGKIALKGG
jgi:hypothetical protein